MGLGKLLGLSGQEAGSFGFDSRFDIGHGRARDITSEFEARVLLARRITAPPVDYVIEERPAPLPLADKAKIVAGAVAQFGFFIR